MANTQAMCTSFMGQLLNGGHQFGSITLTSRVSLTAPTTDTFKAALYLASATINAATTVYTVTGEVSGTGYTAGGVTVTNANAVTATNSSSTAGVAYWTPSASITYTSVTLATAFDTVLLYNSTQGNTAVSVHTFGSQTITAGTFTLTMPTNSTTLALIRLATT
jgi:poly(3-hydroxyalkanoate) synthetase